MTLSKTTSKTFDWLTFVLYLSLVAIGALMIYAAEYNPDDSGIYTFSWNSSIGKQFIWTGVSLLAFITVYIMDVKIWANFAYPIYFITLVLLVLVLLLGVEIKGSTSWFNIAGFSFQPAEFAKIGTALGLASYLSYHKTQLKKRKHILISLSIFLVPAFLILLQPDAGSALIFFSFIIIMFREGLSPYFYIAMAFLSALFIGSLLLPIYSVFLILLMIANTVLYTMLKTKNLAVLILLSLVILASILALFTGLSMELLVVNALLAIAFGGTIIRRGRFVPFTIIVPALILLGGLAYSSQYVFENVLEPHQQNRINDWLRPHLSDPQGTIYNVRQSKLAIVSGGFKGKGFLQGTLTKLDYVPEQSTDFIFSTIGEEQGLVGAFGIILIFLILLLRLTILAERSRHAFSRVYIYSVAGIIFFHFFINIGMSMGIVPVIGIPLPFISKGGTSLLAFSIMLAIVLKQDNKRYAL